MPRDILVTSLDAATTFEELCAEVREMCSLPQAQPLTLKWVDSEGRGAGFSLSICASGGPPLWGWKRGRLGLCVDSPPCPAGTVLTWGPAPSALGERPWVVGTPRPQACGGLSRVSCRPGDPCTVSSQMELEEAFRLSCQRRSDGLIIHGQ